MLPAEFFIPHMEEKNRGRVEPSRGGAGEEKRN